MSTFTTSTQVDLSAEWVSDLLITAFDSQYGGSWYWVNEDDDVTSVRALGGDEWAAVEMDLADTDVSSWLIKVLRSEGRCAVLDKTALDRAWALIVNERPIRSDLVEQFTRSMHDGDLDVDADAADCLVQIALFGQVIYG